MKRAVIAILLAGCAAEPAVGETDTTNMTNCADPPAVLSSTPASFKADVLPIFRQSCSSTSCHGGRAQQPFLGSRTSTDADAKTIREGLMDRYVTPGNPGNSRLMRKLDACVDAMPKGGDPLPIEERDAIRRWITQGANEN